METFLKFILMVTLFFCFWYLIINNPKESPQIKPNYIIDLIKNTDSVYIKTPTEVYKVPFNKIEETINLDTQ